MPRARWRCRDLSSGGRGVLGATAVFWLGQLTAQVATAALFVLVARQADASSFGRAATCYGLALAGAQIVDLGAQRRLLRDAAVGAVSPAQLGALVIAKPVLALGLSPLAVLLTTLVVASPLAAAAAWLYSVLRAQVLAAQALWQVRGHARGSAAVTALERVVASLAGAALLSAGVDAAGAVSLGLLVGAVAAALPAARLFRRLVVPAGVTGYTMLAALRFGRYYASMSVAANLLLLDTAVVSAVAGDAEAGYYGIGARLLGPLLVVTTSLCTALIPTAARGSASVRRPFLLVTGVTLTGIGAVVIVAPRLIELTAGDGYTGAVPAVRAYAAAAGILALAQPIAAWLQARGDQQWVARLVPPGIVVALALSAAGAAVAGAAGAAGAQAVVIAAVTLLLTRRAWLLVRRRARPSEPGQDQSEGDGEVPAGRVAQRGEEDVPERQYEHEGLGQRAGRQRAEESSSEQHDGEQPERHGQHAGGHPGPQGAGVEVEAVRCEQDGPVVPVDGVAVLHQPARGVVLDVGRRHRRGAPADHGALRDRGGEEDHVLAAADEKPEVPGLEPHLDLLGGAQPTLGGEVHVGVLHQHGGDDRADHRSGEADPGQPPTGSPGRRGHDHGADQDDEREQGQPT